MIVDYITRNNLLRASVFSVVTTIPACILVVLMKIYGGESLALPRVFFILAAALFLVFLSSLILLTAVKMDVMSEKTEKAKQIRNTLYTLGWIFLGLLVYFDKVSLFVVLPLFICHFCQENTYFKTAFHLLFCVFIGAFTFMM